MSAVEDVPKSSEPRQRKKQLINEVKETLEFYFSPANVSKDKFMSSLLDQDDYVDLDIFFKFNKIKKLTQDTKIIKKAVKVSDILEISEDGGRVKRKVPLQFKEDETECTIYVENLPPNSSHEWLQKVFSSYGTIDYISLPRFHQTGRPKGFAFIEFRCPAEAQKALEAFGGLASLDGTLNPSDLLTIRTYGQIEEKVEEKKTEILPTDEDSKKRSSSTAFESDDVEGELPAKKTKQEAKENETKKKKKRKRNKKEKEYELQSVYLRVMLKKDWKSLRNKYLNTQKENMKQLKRQMIEQKYCTEKSKVDAKQPEFIPEVIVKLTLGEPPQEPKSFREGLTRGRPSIAYVDISSSNPEVHIRFLNAEAAKSFVKEGVWENITLLTGNEEKKYWDKLFDCWKQKRPNKKRSANHANEPRGREKLINKALQQKDKDIRPSHILFED